MLWHTDSSGDEKLLGVYETKRQASSAKRRLKERPGFFDEGGVFEITDYELNKDYWADGFIRKDGHSLPTWLFRPKNI